MHGQSGSKGLGGTERVLIRGGRCLAAEGVLAGRGVHAGQTAELGPRGRELQVRVAGGARHVTAPDGASEVVFLGREPALLATRHTLRGASGERVAEWVTWAGMLAADPRSLHVWGELAQAADSAAPVWLFGESGTGKERAARALHDFSPRAGRPFIALNCAALPDALADAELFGVTRGAYTGADRDRPGAFQLADGGTLFLDEVGELSLPCQAKLLRALEVGQVARVGAGRPEQVDVRVVAASWRDLEVEVARGRFRHDLLHRLWVLRVDLPRLADRPRDVHALVAARLASRGALHLMPDAAMGESLARQAWPGNVRELLNRVERAVARDDATQLLGDAPRRVATVTSVPHELLPEARSRRAVASRAETADALRHELRRSGTSVRAAEQLGVSRSTLYRWIRDAGLDPRALRHGPPRPEVPVS